MKQPVEILLSHHPSQPYVNTILLFISPSQPSSICRCVTFLYYDNDVQYTSLCVCFLHYACILLVTETVFFLLCCVVIYIDVVGVYFKTKIVKASCHGITLYRFHQKRVCSIENEYAIVSFEVCVIDVG